MTTASARALAAAVPLVASRYSTLRRMMTVGDRRVLVSLGGGALPALSGNLALLRILEELELRPHIDQVWGASAGAIVGAGWASGTPAMEMLDLVASMAGQFKTDRHLLRLGLRVLLSLWPLRRPMPDGVIDGALFRERIARGLRVARIEDCEIPFRCVAVTDDGQMNTHVFRDGPLLPAVFSSMSLPGVMEPWPGDDDGNTYYDGGLVEKTPLRSPMAEHGRLHAGDDLLLLCTHFLSERAPHRATGFLRRFLASLYVLEDVVWNHQLREARERTFAKVVLLDPQLTGTSLFGFERAVDEYLASRVRFAEALSNARIASTLGTM